jgi:hypothetical protein
MKEQQDKRALPNRIEHGMSRIPDCLPGMATHDPQHFHDLARMRIERDRAARHARCSTLRK